MPGERREEATLPLSFAKLSSATQGRKRGEELLCIPSHWKASHFVPTPFLYCIREARPAFRAPKLRLGDLKAGIGFAIPPQGGRRNIIKKKRKVTSGAAAKGGGLCKCIPPTPSSPLRSVGGGGSRSTSPLTLCFLFPPFPSPLSEAHKLPGYICVCSSFAIPLHEYIFIRA